MGTKGVTDSDFDSEVLNSSVPVLVDFWAEWCGPCRALAPKLEEISNELGAKLKVLKMNVDENPNMPVRYGVRGIPTMIIFKGGKQVGQVVGNLPKDEIVKIVSQHM
jgi:thioredoxin 1